MRSDSVCLRDICDICTHRRSDENVQPFHNYVANVVTVDDYYCRFGSIELSRAVSRPRSPLKLLAEESVIN